MTFSVIIKKVLSHLLYSLGIPKIIINNRSKRHFLILMYHRVIPVKIAKRGGVQAGMFVTPENLKIHVSFLKRNFNVISLSDILLVENDSEQEDGKPYCAVTFDDGWQDFYTFAYPILKKENVPVTVFLATDFIGTHKWFWTDRLSRLFMKQKNTINIPPYPSSNEIVNLVEGYRGDFESRLEFAIERMKGLSIEEIEDILTEISDRWVASEELNGRAFLSWDEVIEMQKSGLITFGSHTVSHSILTTLEHDVVRREVTSSRDMLISEGVVEASFIPFCYPNGNYNKLIVDIVKEAKYKMAVTTKSGWNSFGVDPFTLRRIGIHQDMSSTEAMFACKIAQII